MIILEMNRMRLVLFDMNKRIFASYLAAMHWILIPVMDCLGFDACVLVCAVL
jgi:hypothetical protein